ncbi:MAG: SAM-dependent chlorinase/fluorinase [Phaeodactylibacter sp.]|nr:SAM-dependent chlorinase/fluorinase [Phaeodactylibacter sp.]
MPIVTLTTDFGWQDYYLAMIKGAMLCEHPQLNIVDITHSVKNYDIVQAAFLFKNTWRSFPEGTIHLISVNDYYGPRKRYLATTLEGHFFIAPDNGVFSLIFEQMPPHFYELDYDEESPFPLQNIYAQAVGYLAHGRPLIEIGLPAQDIEHRITLQPVIGHSQIRGSIIYVDNYDNAISNITRELFEKVGGGRSFKLSFKRHPPLRRLSRYYHDLPVGEPLCLFNSLGYLEIAVNMGRACTLFGLKEEETIQIDFHS